MLNTLKGSSVTLALFGGIILSASGQAVTGFYDIPLFTGNNYIAAQLSTGGTDSLDTILENGVLNGSTFQAFNINTLQLEPASTFNGTAWSIDYAFGPNGIGGILNVPANGTVRISGNFVNIDGNGNYSFNPPVNGPGTYLLAMAAPLGSDSPAGTPGAPYGTFQQITGAAPVAGDSVETLDGQTQTMIVNTFNGSTWSQGSAPQLKIGQAGFFVLTATTPEPSTYALFGLGAGMLMLAGRFLPRVNRK